MRQTRRPSGTCASSRFRAFQAECLGTSANSVDPFGFDPLYLTSSSLYNEGLNATDFYGEDEFQPTGFPYGAPTGGGERRGHGHGPGGFFEVSAASALTG